MSLLVTGADIYNYCFSVKTGGVGGFFIDTTKANLIIEDAFYQAAAIRFKTGLQNQATKDELANLVTTNNVLNAFNNNSFYLQPQSIINITAAVVGLNSVVTIITVLPHNLITGQTIIVSGAITVKNSPNGTFSVTVTSPTTFTYISGLAANIPTFPYTVNSGIFTSYLGYGLNNGQLNDYIHALSLKAKFLKPVYGLNGSDVSPVLINATPGTPVIITMGSWNPFDTGDQINISGITGAGTCTNANGTWYLKVMDGNRQTFALYTDSKFQTPVVGNGTGVGTAAVFSWVYYCYAKPLMPDEKISVSVNPTESNPRFEIADGMIKIYPLTTPCVEVTIDYKRRPVNVYGTGITIDCNDNVLDLTTYYSEDFLLAVANRAIAIYSGGYAKDQSGYKFINEQMQLNP